MAQALRNSLDIIAVLNADSGEGVAEVMEPKIRNPRELVSRGSLCFETETAAPLRERPFMVEMRGVEPLSEDSSEGFSPSAFRALFSPVRPFAEKLTAE